MMNRPISSLDSSLLANRFIPNAVSLMQPRPHNFIRATRLTVTALLIFAPIGVVSVHAFQEESPPPKSDTAETHVGKGYEAIKDERYQEAAKEFQAALALNPSLTRARYQLAVCWFALGKMPEAREELERLEKETGGDPS